MNDRIKKIEGKLAAARTEAERLVLDAAATGSAQELVEARTLRDLIARAQDAAQRAYA